MAEIFASATAASAALEQCIKLFALIHQAVERQKGLPKLIEKYSAEVSQTKTIIEMIEDEEALKTPNVGDAISNLGSVGETLRNYLTKISVTKGLLQDFVKQFLIGDQVQEKLESIMRDLGNAKLNLIIPMLLSNVGLTWGVGQAVQVNIAAVEAMNKLLTEKLGSGHALKISKLLEGRPRSACGTVTLTEDDIDALSKEEALSSLKDTNTSGDGKSQTTRIIRDNEAFRYALQVNTPIGVDVWKDIGSVTVEGNKATDQASQWNYPIASVDAFLAAMDLRKAQLSSKDKK